MLINVGLLICWLVQKGPARLEAMADIMRRFDRMRRTRDTVKVQPGPSIITNFP
jgi:hypothetical protein